METLLEKLASFLGFPQEWAELIGATGPWGITVIVLGVVIKVLGPSVTAWYRTKRENTDTVLSKMGSMDSTLKELVSHLRAQAEKQDSWKDETRKEWSGVKATLADIHTLTDELGSEGSNKIRDTELTRLFMAHNSKILALSRSYFRYRMKKNHIRGNEEVIAGRYMREAESYAGKLRGIWKGLTSASNGLPVSEYWGSGGAESFCRHLMVEYYGMQIAVANGEATVPEYLDLVEMGDRLESSMAHSFSLWLSSGANYDKQRLDGTLPDMRLNRPLGSIEELKDFPIQTKPQDQERI